MELTSTVSSSGKTRVAEPGRWRTLPEALRAMDDAQLTTLLRLRPDLTYPLPRDLTDLSVRATTATSVGRAVDGLDAWVRTVAEALAALPDGRAVADVAALVGHPDAIAGAVQQLRRRGLVWGSDSELHLVRAVREAFDPFPGGLAPPSPRPLSRAQIETALEACDSAARAVLDRLRWSPTGAVRNAERAVSAQTARSPVDQLLARGLLRPLDADTVILPREVAWRLRNEHFTREPVDPEPPVVAGPVRTPRLVDNAAAGAAFALLHDVELAVHTLETVPHRLLRTGGVAARDVTALARRLGSDTAYATFVLECAAAAGLVAPGGNLCLLPTTDHDRWVTEDAASRWQRLSRAWFAAPRWFSASAEPGTHALGPESDAGSAPTVRRLLVELAAALPAGTRPDLEQLTAALVWHRPRLARGPVEASTLVDWTWREASWLGLVALDAVSTFAPTVTDPGPLPADLAALFPAPVEQVIVQADLTAVAPGPLVHAVASELRLLAEQESRGGGGVYRFSDASLRRAFDAGWSTAEVHTWLAGHSATPVPQPLTYLVDDVGRRHGTTRVGAASAYLRTDDDTEAAALLSHPDAGSLGLRPIAPGVLVASVEPAELVAFLHGMGQTPAVEDEGGRMMIPPAGQRAPRPRTSDLPATAQPEEVAAALLAADRDHPQPPQPDQNAAETDSALDRLRWATQDASPVWVGYVTADGTRTERELAPLDLSGGTVRAVDRANAQVVTIPLSRISFVGPERQGAAP